MDTDKKYYAFISYKREDEKQAAWLQDKLEHYRFPTNLNGRTDLPKSVRPTFRDVTDLAPGLLAEEINQALEESQWLVVVCSPRSAKSPWVCKEAQTFIDSGRADRIIPYVIEGVPFSGDEATECYPEALLNLKGRSELLAANVNEMGRDAALIKVLARMFNLRFDTLWQRHTREQRKKRMLWGSVAAFVVVLSVLVSGWFYRANNEISRQKTQIDNQYHELVDKQDNLLITQSRYLMSEAQKEYDKGNITKALRMALYALPKDLDNPDRPYLAEAERILRLCDTSTNDSICCRSIIEHDYPVTFARFSPDGKLLATVSLDKVLCIWAVETGRLLAKSVENPIEHERYIENLAFSHDGRYIATLSSDDKVHIWLVENGKLTEEKLDTLYYNSFFSERERRIKITLNTEAKASSRHKQLAKVILENYNLDKYDSQIMSLCEDASNIAISLDNKTFIWGKMRNSSKLKKLSSSPIYLTVQAIRGRLRDKRLPLLILNGRFAAIIQQSDSIAIVTDVIARKRAMEPIVHSERISSIMISLDGKYVVTASYDNSSRVYDIEEKKLVATLNHKKALSYAEFNPKDNSSLLTVCSDDAVYIWNWKNNEFRRLLHNDDVEFAMYSPNGEYVLTASRDYSAHLWDVEKCKQIGEPMKHDNEVRNAVFGDDGEYILTVSDDNMVRIWNSETEAVTMPLQHDEYVELALFSLKCITTKTSDGSYYIWPFPPLQELIDKYRNDPEHDWSLSQEEKDEYSLE